MLKKILKSIYLTFISIVLISIILAGWTSYSIITQSPKSNQLTEEIKDIYTNQIEVFINIIDLSKTLLNDTSKSNNDYINNNIKVESNSLNNSIDDENKNESTIMNKNKDNPLEIIIDPSLNETSQELKPEVIEDPLPHGTKDRLINEGNEDLMNEMFLDY
tara:strand:+ start:729 stop:1211 length:483 start_codon:yes stop_codon:yes gene_type:complete